MAERAHWLAGRVAVVTGASRGIGRATAMAVAREGAHVVVAARDAAGLDASRLERIDEHLQTRYIEQHRIAGCQVAVMRHGHLAHFRSLGMRDRERG